jgi:hypothetical protein
MTYRSSARKSVRVARRQRGAKEPHSIAMRPRVYRYEIVLADIRTASDAYA